MSDYCCFFVSISCVLVKAYSWFNIIYGYWCMPRRVWLLILQVRSCVLRSLIRCRLHRDMVLFCAIIDVSCVMTLVLLLVVEYNLIIMSIQLANEKTYFILYRLCTVIHGIKFVRCTKRVKKVTSVKKVISKLLHFASSDITFFLSYYLLEYVLDATRVNHCNLCCLPYFVRCLKKLHCTLF